MKFCFGLSFINPDYFLEIAPLAEQYGYDTVLLSDHVVNPDQIEARYPYGGTGERMWDHSAPWPDVWVATGMMAAVTRRLRFTQIVYVLPMRDPFTVAKALGTCARMSGYRVSLGLGLGWMYDEFEILGHEFAHRGARADEMVEVMRKLWTGKVVEHHGRFFEFPRLSMSPAADGEIPIVVGGNSDPALRRTARLGDGWAPAYLSVDQVKQGLAKIHALQPEYGRSGRPISVYTSCHDAVGIDGYKRMAEAGISHAMCSPWLHFEKEIDYTRIARGAGLQQMKDGIRRFADEVIARL
jgi:probable F420-dependent oxidoreductase